MENSDLIVGADVVRPKIVENGHTPEETNEENCEDLHYRQPPDGGLRAWLVLVGSFLCNGILFGVINTFGVIHFHLHKKLEQEGDTEASSKAALVGSLSIGTMFLLSPVAGVLTDKMGLRLTTLIGGALATGGMLLSSFLCDSVPALFFTYGFMYGLGAALAYTPSLAILGHYFSRYLGLVNGIVTSGSSVFTVIMPVILEHFISTSGLEVTLRVLALMSSFVMLCALLFKPISAPKQKMQRNPEKQSALATLKSVIHLENWKKKRYVIWVIAIPSALFGYFIPYVHMASFVEVTFGSKSNVPIMCIGITSGLGRLIFGFLADHPKVNRIFLQQIAFYSIGVLSMCLPFASTYVMVLVIALGMGLFDGCFISLLGPIAFDLCGQKGGTQGIGFLLGLCSIPLTIGPPIAGLIYDHTQSYTLPFLLSGMPPLVGASIMFFLTCVKDPVGGDVKPTTNGHSLTSNAWKNDINPAEKNGFSNHTESEALTAVTSGRLPWKYNSTPYNHLTPNTKPNARSNFPPQSDHILYQHIPLLSSSVNHQDLSLSRNSPSTYYSCPTSSNFIDNNPLWPISARQFPCTKQFLQARGGGHRPNYQSIPLVD